MKKNSNTILTLIGLASSLTACFGNSPQKGSQASPSAPQAEWTLQLRSECSGIDDSLCIAKYGFQLDSNGRFEIGPGPQGQSRVGTLLPFELQDLKTALQPILLGETTSGQIESQVVLPQYWKNDELNLNRGGKNFPIYKNQDADLTLLFLNSEQAFTLKNQIDLLAEKYYRGPFGDECGNLVDLIYKAQDEAKECEQDSECVYVDPQQNHDIIPPASNQWVLSEACVAHPNLIVANSKRIQQKANELNQLIQNAQTRCENRYFHAPCAYLEVSTEKPALCVQKRCVAQYNP